MSHSEYGRMITAMDNQWSKQDKDVGSLSSQIRRNSTSELPYLSGPLFSCEHLLPQVRQLLQLLSMCSTYILKLEDAEFSVGGKQIWICLYCLPGGLLAFLQNKHNLILGHEFRNSEATFGGLYNWPVTGSVWQRRKPPGEEAEFQVDSATQKLPKLGVCPVVSLSSCSVICKMKTISFHNIGLRIK